MKKEYKIKLDNAIDKLSFFLESDFSSRFKALSQREDRQLFFLAKILTELKSISVDLKEESELYDIKKEECKVIPFPALRKD